MDYKIIQKAGRDFTEGEKHKIIEELIATRCTKQKIWKKYTGENAERGQLLRWIRALGYDAGIKKRRTTIVSDIHSMAKKTIKKDLEEDDCETLQLKKRILELEKQLKEAELKAIAFSTMVDIAEKEFKIPIRKKLNTKP